MRAEDQGRSPDSRRGSWALRPFWILLGLVALVLLVLLAIPVNEYAEVPGEALAVSGMIAVQGHGPVKGAGKLLMTDVTLIKLDHLLEDLYYRFQPHASLQPAGNISGNLSQTKFEQETVAEMQDSIQQAEVAAFNATPGYHVRCCRQGPDVLFTYPHTPADTYLRQGDIIVGVDGHTIHLASQVGRWIKKVHPGDRVRLVILRGGHRMQLNVPTIASKNGDPTQQGTTPIIGVLVQDRPIFPVKVSITAGSIGGPSAGLMFSLGIVQRLEQRDLTHGCTVAGTGTIDSSGKVGPIGGAEQKIVAARDAGARYFLVPDVPENVDPARSARGNVVVVPVKTLRQALTFLQRLKPCR